MGKDREKKRNCIRESAADYLNGVLDGIMLYIILRYITAKLNELLSK